jgi:hypothetical protein
VCTIQVHKFLLANLVRARALQKGDEMEDVVYLEDFRKEQEKKKALQSRDPGETYFTLIDGDDVFEFAQAEFEQFTNFNIA